MKEKPTDTEIEDAKVFIREAFDKFRRITPEGQERAIQMLTDLIKDEDEPKTKDFFIKLKMIFVEAAKTEVKSNEK